MGHPFQDKIYNENNCVLVHQRCHQSILGTGGNEVFYLCAKQLVQWMGYESVYNWLQEMDTIFTIAGRDALHRFIGYEKELKNG